MASNRSIAPLAMARCGTWSVESQRAS